MTALYVAADNPGNQALTERNQLLLDWYCQAGLRRFEWAALSLSQIPDWTAIDGLREANDFFELLLTTTKGGRRRHVGVSPELLERTREYIEGTRAEVIARFERTGRGIYRAPAEVFISNKTGLKLNLRAITNILTDLFRRAKVEGHGHRLRATYLTSLFEAELLAEEARMAAHPGTKSAIDYELILRKVAERAGHKSIESLRHYLVLARKRRAREGGAAELVTLELQLRAKRMELALLEHRIATQRNALES